MLYKVTIKEEATLGVIADSLTQAQEWAGRQSLKDIEETMIDANMDPNSVEFTRSNEVEKADNRDTRMVFVDVHSQPICINQGKIIMAAEKAYENGKIAIEVNDPSEGGSPVSIVIKDEKRGDLELKVSEGSAYAYAGGDGYSWGSGYKTPEDFIKAIGGPEAIPFIIECELETIEDAQSTLSNEELEAASSYIDSLYEAGGLELPFRLAKDPFDMEIGGDDGNRSDEAEL